MTKWKSDLGERLNELRRRHDDMPQAELSRATEALAKRGEGKRVSQATISRILSGENTDPGVYTVQSLAKALHTSVSALLDEERGPGLPDPITYFCEYYGVDEATAQSMRNVISIVVDIGRSQKKSA